MHNRTINRRVKHNAMPRKSITFTHAHDKWLKAQVASGQYRSESEEISDLIRERQNRNTGIEAIRLALIEGEKSGLSKQTPEDIRKEVQERLRKDGSLPTQ